MTKPYIATNKSPTKKARRKRGKQHAQPKRGYNKKSTAPVSRSLLTTVVLLLIVTGWALYSLNQVEVDQRRAGDTQDGALKVVENSSSAHKSEKIQSTHNPDSGEDDYDFYVMLKDLEVIVRDDGAYSSERKDDQGYHYLIQAGSFKTAEQAETLRANLLLLGLEPSVDASTNAQGNTWHRVRIGPFTSRKKMAAARTTIIENGIDAMVMKRRKKG